MDELETIEIDYLQEMSEKGAERCRRDKEGMTLLGRPVHVALTSQNDGNVLHTQNINQRLKPTT